MNFTGRINTDEKIEVEFDDLQAGMAEALEESLHSDDAPAPKDGDIPVEDIEAKADDLPPYGELTVIEPPVLVEAPAENPEPEQRLTVHTQSRLAALNSFDKLYGDAQAHLQEIEAKLTEVTTSHHLTRQFFNILHADIHRANELELTNANLLAEQKRLTENLQDQARKHQEREAAVEAMQQREATHARDRDMLRADLAAARLDLVEAGNTIARNDAELGEMIKTLSARAVEIERRTRENEVLREKQVSLTIDLDKALKREAEARRKQDEISAIHANEAARNVELLVALGKTEKEVLRLQKALETAHLKHAEMADEARIVEAERQAEVERNLAEMRGLRSEIQNLQSHLEQASISQEQSASEIAALKVQLSDSIAEKLVVDERLSELRKENELDKQSLLTASANISQLSLEQASEQMQLDVHRQECEDLRAEIATLNARINELLPHERMYRVAKARLREAGAGIDVEAPTAEEVRRAPTRNRMSPQPRSAANGSRR